MKKRMYDFKKMQLLAICFAFFCSNASATTFTALVSGAFSSAATWGGIAPGTLLSTDVIIIPSGINVLLLAGTETFSGTSSLVVNGTLSSATGAALVITAGTLSGAGTISVDSAALGLVSGFTFTGSLTARKLTSVGANVSTAANVVVNNALHLNSGSLIMAAGNLTMGNHSTITLAGGTISSTGTGVLHLDSAYSVIYTLTSATTGAELTGTGLDSITVTTAGTVTMAANTVANGIVTLTAGILSLNDHTLTFNTTGNLSGSGTGTIMGSALSNIVINSATGLTGTLRFAPGGNMLNNLTVNTGTGSATLGNDLTVNGLATLTAGSLALNGHNLTFGAGSNLSATGTGTITGNTLSNIFVNATTGLSGALRFATGANTINNLTINTGAAGNVSLGSDLVTNGVVTLTNGTLSLNGHGLTINNTGDLAAAGTGTIMGSAASNLIINTTGSISSPLRFATGGNILNNLTINTGGNVSLSSDLITNGMVTLSNGTLWLNGHTLTLNTASDLAATGTGVIMGSTTSNLVVNSTAGLTGAIRFATGGNMLNNLTINTGTGSAALGNDLTVYGLATLTAGSLALNGHNLTFAPAGDLAASGTGTITGNVLSNVIVNAATGLTGVLRFATGANTINNLTISTGAAGNVSLGSDLVTNGVVTLTNGTLWLNGHSLTINPTGDLAAAGTGTIMGSATSNLIVNTTGSLSSPLRFATGGNILNNLTINTGGNVSLNSDLTTNGMVTLSNGTLWLNGHTLTLNTTSNLAATGTGSIMGSVTSNLVVNSTTGLTGAIRFATGGNMLNNLTVNTGTGSAMLGSDLTVYGLATLTAGSLALNGYNLTLATGSDLASAGTGTITGNPLSSIIVNATTGLTGTLRFATGANTINNLTISTGAAGNVSLGSDLVTNGVVTLTNGTLSLNGHGLTINTTGDLAAAGTGTIMGSAVSNLTVNSASGLTGAIRFATGGNMLNNLTVNTGTGSAMLGNDLTVNGLATLTAGSLALNGHNLTFATGSDLAAAGTGTITGSPLSNIVINSTTGLTGALRFATGANTINDLVVNTGAAGNVSLGSDLATNGVVTLTNGTLSLNGHGLTINPTGDLAAAGTGTIMGSATSNLIVNTTGSLSSPLRFATGGNVLNNLTINTGGNVSLSSDLTTDGMVTLSNGTLSLNGHTLTLNTASNLAATGTGSIMGSTTSNLVLNSASGLTGAIRFATGGNMLNNLTVNTGTGSAMLGNDLTVNGVTTLTAGSLALNGHNLTFATGSDLAAAGTGTITGNPLSSIIVNTTTGLTGALRFATGANTINNLTVNTGAAGNVSLGSDLVTNGVVTLTNGTLSLNGHGLTINTTGDLATGAGTIMGSATSNLTVNTTGSLSSPLRFATGGNVLNNLTINTSGNVSLNSDLTADGMVTLSNGTLSLNGHSLTLNTASDLAAAGTGRIMGSATSNIIINSTAGLTGALRFATGGNMLHNLSVNTAAGNSVSLGSDLNVYGSLNLQSGKIKLGGNNLDIAAGGMVNGGSPSSYVITDGTGNLGMNLAAGMTDTFAVGTLANFAPMTIAANAGSATGNVNINVADGVLAGGYTGASLSATQPVVNATWFVSSSSTGAINYNMTAAWSAGMEVNSFDRSHAYISHYTGGAWDAQVAGTAGTAGSMYTMSRTGITSLSPFMVTSEGSTGTSNISVAQPEISVYPNPTTNTLHYSSSAAVASVSIYDMSGKYVQSSDANNDVINVANLPAGVYVIHFIGNETDVVKQFVKQ